MKKFMIVLVGTFLSLFVVSASYATIITFESLPAENSQYESTHGVGGPVLADDFIPLYSGTVTRVDWWGMAPLTDIADSWEITFHPDNGGAPLTTFPDGELSQHFVSDGGSDPDGDGIYFYSALWEPMDLFVEAGISYWFSVANASANLVGGSWTWANAFMPTVGSEAYDTVGGSGICAT